MEGEKKEPAKKMRAIGFWLSFSLVLGFLCLAVIPNSFTGTSPVAKVEGNYENFLRYSPEEGSDSQPDTLKLKDSYDAFDGETPESFVKELYAKRYADYLKNNNKMSGLIQLLAALVALGILLLIYQPSSLEVPGIKISVPDTLLYIFISIGLVYVWLQFGLTLNSGIDSRLTLQSLNSLLESFNEFSITYEYSDNNTLVDKGVLDTWFSFYHDAFAGGSNDIAHQVLGCLGMFLIYGTFWGLAHAICFILISTLHEKKKGGAATIVLYTIAFLLFALADISFIWEFRYALLLMAWNWGVVVITMFMWNLKGDKLVASASDHPEESAKDQSTN